MVDVDPLNPWYIPGWTIQNPILVFPNSPVTPIQLPADILISTVTANYAIVSGRTLSGSILFKTVGSTLDTTYDTLILPGMIRGPIAKGVLSINIPSGFTYKVQEFIPGGRKFTVNIPANHTGTVSLNSLIVPDSSSL